MPPRRVRSEEFPSEGRRSKDLAELEDPTAYLTDDSSPQSSKENISMQQPQVRNMADDILRTANNDGEVKYTIEEVKEMVLSSIPEAIKSTMTPATWEHIFDEASKNVLDEDIDFLERETTEEDVKDIITFISVYVQREARQKRKVSITKVDASGRSEESATTKSTKKKDAISLALENIPDDLDSDDDDGDSFASNPVPRRPEQRALSPLKEDAVERPNSRRQNSRRVPSTRVSQKRIMFTKVQVRHYEQILTDNPAVTTGPPVGIGWKYRGTKKDLSVDDWEKTRVSNRRYLNGLLTGRHERTSTLFDLGYSQQEIALAVREVLKVKNCRKQTFHNLKFERMEELVEKTRKKLLCVCTLGLSKRKERQLLKPFK